MGTFLIFTLAGYLADNSGWEAVFYVTGALTLVWVGFWFYLAYDTPGQHPRIDTEERRYIETALGDSADIDRYSASPRQCVVWCVERLLPRPGSLS